MNTSMTEQVGYMTEQMDDFDRKELKELRQLTIAGAVAMVVLAVVMISVWCSLPGYDVVYTNKVKVDRNTVDKSNM